MNTDRMNFYSNEDDSEFWVSDYSLNELATLDSSELSSERAPMYMEIKDEFTSAYRHPEVDPKDATELVKTFYNKKGLDSETPFHIKRDYDSWAEGFDNFGEPDTDDIETWFDDLDNIP